MAVTTRPPLLTSPLPSPFFTHPCSLLRFRPPVVFSNPNIFAISFPSFILTFLPTPSSLIPYCFLSFPRYLSPLVLLFPSFYLSPVLSFYRSPISSIFPVSSLSIILSLTRFLSFPLFYLSLNLIQKDNFHQILFS